MWFSILQQKNGFSFIPVFKAMGESLELVLRFVIVTKNIRIKILYPIWFYR